MENEEIDNDSSSDYNDDSYNNDSYNNDSYNDDSYNDDSYNNDSYNDDSYNDDSYNELKEKEPFDEDEYFNNLIFNDEHFDEINSENNDSESSKKRKIDEDDEKYDKNNEDKDKDEKDKIEEDKMNKDNKDNQKNKRKPFKKRKKEEDSLNRMFSIIIGSSPKSYPFTEPREPPYPPPQYDKNKKNKKENFYDYFKEADELLPINKKIETLQDLIDLGETYDKNDKKRYVINMKALHKCIKPLKELNNFIGMKNIKEMIMDLIFFRLQNIEDDLEKEMWHLVVQGSPGCGKTEVSKVIGKLYYGLGIVEKDTFMQVKRSQLIGKFCGHTAAQTQEIFDEAEGGVLFIDEAYSLGITEKRDTFTKECIDTINQNLTEKKNC